MDSSFDHDIVIASQLTYCLLLPCNNRLSTETFSKETYAKPEVSLTNAIKNSPVRSHPALGRPPDSDAYGFSQKSSALGASGGSGSCPHIYIYIKYPK